jgi:anti-sigma B factor antagonist
MAAADDRLDSRRLELTKSTTMDGGVRLSVSGEIDISTVDQLRSAVMEVLGQPGVSRLLLDFDPLRFLDSSGIAALIGAYRTAEEQGVGFGVLNCHGTVRHVLEITGVYEVLAADDSA